MRGLLLFAACIGLGLSGKKTQTSDLSEAVERSFREQGDPMIRFDMQSYQKFAIEKPRKYHLFVIFTANMQMCKICKPFEDALSRAAVSFFMSFMSGKHDSTKEDVPVFFGVVDIGPSADIARLHGISTLPHILHYSEETELKPAASGVIPLPASKFNVVKLDISADELLAWANQEARTDVSLYYTTTERIFRALSMIVVIVSAIFLIIKLVLLVRRKPVYIAIVGLMIHYVATSGIFYNLLHGMTWVGQGPNGKPQYLFGGARGQYLGEGLSMSALTVLSGVTLFLAARLPYTDYARKADPNSLAFRLLGLVIISAVCVYAVIGVYIMKMGWYSEASMLPPAWYRTGPLRVDQGNSF